MGALKTGMAAVGKWILTHKKVVVGIFIAISGAIGVALKLKSKGEEEIEAIEAGEDPELIDAESTAEEEPEENSDEKSE